ncbi:DsbA family protein [Brevundimonas staleyi]|uniref:DsbA family protein n=1 Tax=Brevundimonas staleyi TaxID=74326 RepID=A0ABW0FYA2_9CAUL
MTAFRTLILALTALTLASCGGAKPVVDGDMALGAAEGAKVTVVEYASPTCPHCAAWQENTWPAFKAAYVDTNKVRYVFRELPTPPNAVAAAGFLMARCAGEDKYFDVIHAIMRSQKDWQSEDDMRASLVRIAGENGMDQAAFQRCVTNPEAIAALERRVKAATDAGVTGTPTFFVNGRHVSSMGGEGVLMSDLGPAIDAELAK